MFTSSLRASRTSASSHRTQPCHHLSTLRQRCFTPALDVLQAWPCGIAEWAGLLPMSQTKVVGAVEANEEASPSLRHLPHVGPFMDLSTTPSQVVHHPWCCWLSALILYWSSFVHFCDHKLFPLLPCGIGPKLGSWTSVAPVVCFVQRGLCWRGSGVGLAIC